MSEISRDMETNIGPDLFQYYIRGISELLSRDDFPPSSSATSNGNSAPLFCNIAGDGLSDLRKTRLNAMLRQSVVALTQEVDEMLDPVISMRRLRDLMAPTNASYQDEKCSNMTENRPQKKLKIPTSYSIKIPQNVSPVSCTITGEPSCLDSSEQANDKDMNESFLGSSSRDAQEHGEVNDDLQVLLVNKGPLVEEKMEKHSIELSAQLGRMEEKLEELLDIVTSSCRPMTVAEKHKLRGMIEKLHLKNLDRVVEIIRRRKPSEQQSCCDINVDLQNEAIQMCLVKTRLVFFSGLNLTVFILLQDDLTLWRIYFYVTAAENARKL